MSNHNNKAVLTSANAAIAKGDHEGFLAHCTDDVVWEFVCDQTIRGKTAVRAYIENTYIEPPTFTVTDLIAEADTLAALGEISIKDKSGKTVRSRYCDVWRLRDGKLAELRAYVVELNEH